MAAENHNGGRSPSVNPTKGEHSLDALARGLADGTVSRRKALRLMGGVLLGGTFASIPGIAWAKPKPGMCKKVKDCPPGEACCNGVCTSLGTTENCFACGNKCSGADPICCGGICLNSTNNDRNCGCCECSCEQFGQHCCNKLCVDWNTDNSNCGSCGRTCDPNPPSCEENCSGCDCDKKQCPGQLILDPSGQTCNCVCPAGTTACGNECCNSANCQTCDPNTGRCVGCPENFLCCDGGCFAPTDQRHCGFCGNNCIEKCNSGGGRCCDGICVVTATTCDDARVC
jgi:hypothetical protein